MTLEAALRYLPPLGVLRLTFYYAHVGFYVTQGLVSASMPILVTWRYDASMADGG